MKENDKLSVLHQFASRELNDNILPFWRNYVVDHEHGGFYGEITNDLKINKKAPKGLILNARLLWTFSSAYQMLQNKTDLELAKRAFDFLCQYFYDKEYGGYYWTVGYDNKPLEAKNQIYALAFVIYGMSQYYEATGEAEALNRSNELLKTIEEHAYDPESNGYYEAFSRNWQDTDDARLSDKDINEKKTMNTHLHILEAYCNLYRIHPNHYLGAQLKNLVRLFLDHFISKTDYHLNLFFNDHWESKSTHISYGHDIEAGWLIHESALLLGDKNLIQEVEQTIPKVTDAALEGLAEIGGLYHESDRKSAHFDHEFEWWPQAESLVGLVNTYQVTRNEKYLDYAVNISKFIQEFVVDHENGEWFYRTDQSGNALQTYPKTGLWKCPYHNARACMELIKRIESKITKT